MITEKEREQQSIDKVKDGIQLCQEAIAKAEKYERLSNNPDWKAYLDDIRGISDIHEREIQLAISQMDESPNNTYVRPDGKVISSKLDWADYILRHRIRGDMCREWIMEPERILTFSRIAREKLPILEKQLKEMVHEEPVVAGENGKS